MRFKLTLHKEFEIDTDKHWDKDLTGLYEKLRDQDYVGNDTALAGDIQTAIEAMLADDIETVVDLELDDTDFKVVVEPGTTVTLPDDNEDEDC